MRLSRIVAVAVSLLSLIALPPNGASAASTQARAVGGEELKNWTASIDRMLQGGELRVGQIRQDTLIEGREHARLAQFYKGVPVFGGELAIQSDGGPFLTVFGTLYEDIDIDPAPALSADQALRIVEGLGAVAWGSEGTPELTILPKDDGFALTYRLRAWKDVDLRMYFVDARDGGIVFDYSDRKTQAVGAGTGVLNDQKKVSTRQSSGAFLADDKLRPPVISTYDYRGDLFRFLDFFDSPAPVPPESDLASDSDNVWTDGADVDAHAYAGYTYDYYFRRFGRRGLDNANIPIRGITHPVRREDIFQFPNNLFIEELYLNAFYAGDGYVVYGEGLPPGLTAGGQSWNYLAGALDIVGHELTHGVTDYSSRLIYRNESGALNEAFSDMLGTSIEFYFQQPGNGFLRADYLIGEDVITPGGLRSMQSPAAFGDPDHYSLRYLGREDNGGVHVNNGIPNHAFYLAIEGGTNRVSGMAVQGVGPSNREQIERVFYRAFTAFLTPAANFSQARAATIQAARELFGAGSAAERAVTQAWTAVGVN